MILEVEAAVYSIRGGVGVSIDTLRLAAHGTSEHEAIAALEHTVEVWALNLRKNGWLEGALRRAGINYHEDGGPLKVQLRIVQGTRTR